jgi:type IV pilus assembly protein PilX
VELNKNRLNMKFKKDQRGVVLIVSLVFLIALTAVAAALMQNTTSDMKMSGASEEKVIATQEAISAVDEAIYRQVNGDVINGFASALVLFPLTVTASLEKTNVHNDTSASIYIANNPFKLEADCPPSKSASSVQVFTCNVLKVQVIRKYGRANSNEIEVTSGIAQQLLR